LIKALGVVLVENEFARRRWIQGQVENSNDANIGIAVADGIDEIVVPVVQAPALRSLEGIAEELARLGEAVRSRSLRREDMMDAVATISNLGMFGVDALLPIIPPSQSFILGVGRDRKEVILDELGRPMSRTVATFSLAGDHRVLTGLGGARILQRLDELVQHPLRLAAPGDTGSYVT
jgi:pyruvate dehydrogenase E2 component (dihydrolipoamide acetyltransferase)